MNSVSALLLLVAVAQARFGQEQIPIPAIAAVQGGQPGVAQTIAGAAISDLLAGANACAKLQRADQILQELGTGADAVAAAIGMVSAEKNVNPFVQQQPTICNDPTLPANQVLRGITPLVDPAFANANVANALSAQTVATPLDASGKSVADLLTENGFTDFLVQAVGGTPSPAGGAAANAGGAAGTAASTAAADTATVAQTAVSAADTAAAAATDFCAASVAAALASASSAAAMTAVNGAAIATGAAAPASSAADVSSAAMAAAAANTAPPGAVNGTAAAAGGGNNAAAGVVDFGKCNPTIKFEGGLGGRPATEFTFQSQDPKIAAIQQEALNPNIITNRICDEFTNQCGSNAAAKSLCLDAKAQILALGTRDVTTAQKWNELLGFPGTVTNPDGGPATPQDAGAKMRQRRSLRA